MIRTLTNINTESMANRILHILEFCATPFVILQSIYETNTQKIPLQSVVITQTETHTDTNTTVNEWISKFVERQKSRNYQQNKKLSNKRH